MSKKTGGFLRTLAVLCSAILLFEAGAITPFAEETPGLSFAEEAETGSTSKIQEEEEVIAYLLGEDTGRRDESVKQFRRSDGSMVAALYDEPVHYEVDGEWKEIDNTLVPSENRGGIAYMKNRSNDFTVWLPENMSVGRTVEVGYRGRTLRFALEQTAQTRSAAPQVEGVLRQPETDGGARLRELQASFRETTGLDKTPEAVKECSALSVTANALSPAAADEARNLAREIETEITGVKTISAGVTYADLQPGVDLAYDIQGKSLKESLVLHEGPGAASYSFVLDGGGLTGTLNEDQSVTFCDADGTEFFQIAAPYMWDAANETSYAVDVELQETTGGYLYTITPDADWLTAAERVYPVTIDPTIFTRQERASIENGFISSGNPGSSHYHYGSLPVGVDSSTEKIMRSYVNFDLPNLGASEIVTGASLNLVQYQQSFYASHMGLYTINIHQVLTDWDPNTMTWNSRGAGSNADYDHKVLDYIQLDGSENGNGTWDARYSSQASYLNSRSFDVTKVVRQWYQDPSSRHGLMLKAAVENGSYAVCGAYANFISKYYTTTPAGNYPVMVISYRSNKGLEGYWDYHSQDMGRAGTGYIQDYTGNLVYEHMDVSTPGGRMPVSISHYYNGYQAGENLRHDPYNIGSDNSALDVVPRTGMGWKLNLQQTLVAVHEESGLAGAYTHVYTDGDGTEHYFFEQDGKIIDEDGLGYTLSDGTHGGKRITTKDKSFLDFDAAGRLVYIENADGNHITVNLKMLGGYWVIDYVEDGAGDRITFQTDADTHLLTGLTDSAGRTTSYGYTGGGVKQLLTSITYPDGTETRFLYIGNRLTRVIDRTGIEMVYTYTNDGAYRVNSAYEKTGNTVGESLYATYGPDNTSTFVTSGVDNLDDADDIQTIYCFNNSGQTVSSSTALLSGGEFGGSVRNYTSPSGINPHSQKNNRIITEAQISLNVNNLLKNHSVEYDTDTWTPSHMGSNYGYTAELSSGEAYVGQRSVSLQKPPSYASDAVAIYQQDISLERGKMYTFSSYVKTENITSEYERSGAYLMVTYQDGSNSTVTAYPDEFLQGTTEGWTRTSLTFTVPSDAASPVCRMHLVLAAEAYGHAWFDGMQLEEGAIANPYNLVENPSFERYDTVGTPESWALSGRGAGDCVTGAEAKEGGLSYKMLGSPLVEKNISQGIMVGGTERDTYIFSAWAKADSVPVTEDLSRSFYACIKIRYTDGYETWTPGQSFNAQVGAWQYLSHVFTLDDGTDTERTPESVTYYLCYYRNANTAYFDNIQLIREDVPSYTYDNNGDLVSVTGRETTSQFSSDNGTLTKMVDTKEAYAYYNYSRETNTLLGARTKSGVEYTFTYDGNGNVTGTELVSNPLETAVRSGVAYNLRNKRSGLYLEVLGGWTGGQADGTLVVQGAAEDNIGQRWVMTAASGGYVVTPDYWRAGRLYVGSASAGTQAEIRNTSVNSVWAFQKNSDGTFSLKNTNSQRFLGLAGTSNDREEKAVLKDWDSRDESQKWYLERVTPVSGTKMTSSAAYTPDGAFVESMTDNFGHVTRYTTDTGKGLTTKVETLYGTEDVRTVDYTYDVSDRVKTVTSGTGSVEYTYANTRLSGIRHNGFDYLLTYDGFGNRTQTSVKGTDGVTRVLSTNTYGPSNGELERVTYGNGQSVAYSYDQLGRVRSQGNNGEYEWYYTNSGQLTDSYDYVNAVHTRYAYDTTGRLIRASTNQNQSAQYSYDVSNNVTKVLYRTFGQNRKTEYGYGLEERLESAQLPGGKTVTYGYDGFNRMIQRKLGNLHTVTYEYEVPVIGKTSGRLSRMINGGTALSYTYDAAGNITTIVENGTERVRYRYDELNQLVREDSAVQNKSIEYVYDGGGNLLARKEYAYTTGELGGVMNTVSYGYSGSWKDLLTSYNGTAISYDTIGNPLTWRGGLSFTWQNGRQLSTAQKSGLSLSYQYNASGIRTEKTVNGVTTEYYLDGSSIVAEKRDTDVIWYLYDGMGLAGFELNGTSYYYVYNGQGDVIGILDSSGNRVVTYTYDSWGSPLSVTGSRASTVGQKNPIRYRGYYYDTETGLYYLQSRYYDPVVGRFLNADGLLGANGDLMSYNLFAYCSNNPVNMSDPTGEIAAVTAAFIGLAAAVILQGFTPENKERADNFMNEPNLYNTANWLTLGAVDTVKGAIRPEEPLSLQHWADSAQTALMVMPAVYGIGKSLSTVKPSCFWSGGGMANAGSAAMDFAKLQGSKTLETTMKGRLLSKLPSRISRPLWQPLSRQYAQQARGPVYAIINDNYVRANSIFYTDELPILWENYMNGQVTSIHILHY